MHLDYFEGSMFEAVETISQKYPDYTAFVFMGKKTTYKTMVEEIIRCAKSLKMAGVHAGDKVTVAMPNCHGAGHMICGITRGGGVAIMVHPYFS